MLVRLANVVRWLGLLLGVAFTCLYALAAYEHRDCASALQQRAAVARDKEAAFEKYMRDHPPQPPGVDAITAELEAAANVPADVRDTPEFQQQVEACQQSGESVWTLAVGWALTLVLWSLAYVLGGAFWLPSRRRAAA